MQVERNPQALLMNALQELLGFRKEIGVPGVAAPTLLMVGLVESAPGESEMPVHVDYEDVKWDVTGFVVRD